MFSRLDSINKSGKKGFCGVSIFIFDEKNYKQLLSVVTCSFLLPSIGNPFLGRPEKTIGVWSSQLYNLVQYMNTKQSYKVYIQNVNFKMQLYFLKIKLHVKVTRQRRLCLIKLTAIVFSPIPRKFFAKNQLHTKITYFR